MFDVLWVLSFTFVFDVSGVSVFVSSVVDDLSTAIGKNDTVRSGDYIAVAFLGEGEIGVRFFVLDVITESVRAGFLLCDEIIQEMIIIDDATFVQANFI